MMDLAALGIVATAITKAIDYIRSTFDKDGRAPKELWVLLSLIGGVIFSLLSKANLLATVDWASSVGVVSGRLMTGLAIGGVACGWHELFDLFSGGAKALHVARLVQESKNRIVDDPHGGEDLSHEDDLQPDVVVTVVTPTDPNAFPPASSTGQPPIS